MYLNYTIDFNVDSSVINDISYNENNGTLYLEFVSGAIYEYVGVSAESVFALASADSVGHHYNTVFKGSYGPGRYITESAFYDSVVRAADGDGKYSISGVLVEDEPVFEIASADTKEYSLAAIPEAPVTVATEHGFRTVVEFTINGYDDVFEFEAAPTGDVSVAIAELHSHVSKMGATGSVKRVVVTFD